MDERAISDQRLDEIVEGALRPFYQERIDKLNRLRLTTILQSKNIYMFRAMGIKTIPQFIRALLTAYASSSDESKFGRDFFEPIVRTVSRGDFPSTRGMDLVIETDDAHIDMTVKSGPNWGNSGQWREIDKRFIDAVGAYVTHAHRKQYIGILGQCYGTVNRQATSGRPYHVMSGQRFWAFLTGNDDFYLRLLRGVGRVADAHTHEYGEAFESAVVRLTAEFVEQFATPGDTIDWEAILRFNSGA